MKESWTKEGTPEAEKEMLSINAKAENNLASIDNTPTKEVLEPEYQAYIESRFPKTNDDNLQEDYSKHLVVEGYDVMKTIHSLDDAAQEGEKTKEFEKEKQEEALIAETDFINKKIKLNNEVSSLQDKIHLLELQRQINPRFTLAKSGDTNEISSEIINKDIAELEEDVNTLKAQLKAGVDTKTLDILIEKHMAARNAFEERMKAWYPSNPELN